MGVWGGYERERAVWGMMRRNECMGCDEKKWVYDEKKWVYGVATISRLLEIIGLFCKRAL